jgi:hypothetical protein
MANVARRAVLKMMGVAPIAGPIAAQEVAAKMGVGSLIGGGAQLAKRYADTDTCATEVSPTTTAQRILNYRNDLAYWKSAERRRELRRRYRREHITLDADLASHTSLSPAAARSIQIERLVDEEVNDHVSMIGRWINDLMTGKDKF